MHSLFLILDEISVDYSVNDYESKGFFEDLKPITNDSPDSLVFIDRKRRDCLELVQNCTANVLLADVGDVGKLQDVPKKVVFVEDPKLVYAKVAREVFGQDKVKKVDVLYSVIGSNSKVAESATISDGCKIGSNCSIGENTVIHPNVVIYDGVTIGDNVVVHSGSTIGVPGFGFIKDNDGKFINFPHIGSVVIESDVTIGANCTISKGALGNTVIGKNTQLDNMVHVAHNVVIGENCLLAAKCMIAGSVTMGDDVWIGPGANLRDAISIGSGASISIGSTVTRSVDEGVTVTGYMAQLHGVFMKRYLKLFK